MTDESHDAKQHAGSTRSDFSFRDTSFFIRGHKLWYFIYRLDVRGERYEETDRGHCEMKNKPNKPVPIFLQQPGDRYVQAVFRFFPGLFVRREYVEPMTTEDHKTPPAAAACARSQWVSRWSWSYSLWVSELLWGDVLCFVFVGPCYFCGVSGRLWQMMSVAQQQSSNHIYWSNDVDHHVCTSNTQQ